MPGALDAALGLPQGSVVTVTCSPSRGVAATIDLAEQLRACGYRVETHLAARRFESHAHLQDTVACLDTAGIGDVFVIGGDGDSSAGPFAGADLIAALAEIAPHLQSMGIPCYREGHAAMAPSCSTKHSMRTASSLGIWSAKSVSMPIRSSAGSCVRATAAWRCRCISVFPASSRGASCLALPCVSGWATPLGFLSKNTGFWTVWRWEQRREAQPGPKIMEVICDAALPIEAS